MRKIRVYHLKSVWLWGFWPKRYLRRTGKPWRPFAFDLGHWRISWWKERSR